DDLRRRIDHCGMGWAAGGGIARLPDTAVARVRRDGQRDDGARDPGMAPARGGGDDGNRHRRRGRAWYLRAALRHLPVRLAPAVTAWPCWPEGSGLPRADGDQRPGQSLESILVDEGDFPERIVFAAAPDDRLGVADRVVRETLVPGEWNIVRR